MARYVVSQLGRFLLLMMAVAVVTFALVSLSPVDPLQANVGQAALMSMSEEKRAALAAYWLQTKAETQEVCLRLLPGEPAHMRERGRLQYA